MLKIFLLYALLSALMIVPWFTITCCEQVDLELEQKAKEIGATKGQMLAVMYTMLILLGWAWLPYKVFSFISKRVKGE